MSTQSGYPESPISAEYLRSELLDRQLSSLFTDDGRLHDDVLAGAYDVIRGENIGNPEFARQVAERGGDVRDWAKFTSGSMPWQHGRVEAHFYMNRMTLEVMYELDYKSKVMWSR
ncbi:hypothetical protein ACFWPA_08535 [Rhodococcus sp. NPDC058505]|uniref:hypothetical protein n=1 Tax=unclassified Rhodococcus (in: high G+C Gram-positive bacteria) TaxID=192944 RepID=UPI0036482219